MTYTRVALAVLGVLVVVPAALADEEAAALRALLAKRAPSIVTVRAGIKYQSKTSGESQSEEMRLAMQGVVVSPDGLVMMTNMPFAPRRLMEVIGAGDASGAGDVKMTPTSLKVSLPGDDKEYEAYLAATDTNLDLAFLKIEDLAGKTLAAVDFATSTDAAVGDRVYFVTRLTKGFDFAPCFQSARLGGEVAKPRKAFTLDGGASQIGLPAFDASGGVIGVVTTLASGVRDDGSAEAMGFSMMVRTLGGGSTGGSVFVVPASTVKAVVDQAAAKAIEVAAERAKKKAAGPPPAPAPTKPAAPPTKPAGPPSKPKR